MTALLLLATIVSMLLHEAAHGIVASSLGDPIPARWKRATWNPLAHIDPLMTLALPLILGWCTGWRLVVGAARPMPIGWNHLGRINQLSVIFAGVATNAALGLLALAIGRPWCQAFADLQAVLVIVNLLPIAPLDGWRLVQWTRRALPELQDPHPTPE